MAVRSTTTITELIGLTGMTQEEAADYLEIPLGTLRLYARGRTFTPPEHVHSLYELVRWVLNHQELPAKAPDSVRRRQEVLHSVVKMIDRARGTDAAIDLPLRRYLVAELKKMKVGQETKEQDDPSLT